ncbi:MAG: hypothetical protein KAR32_09990, partial [Candidatus Omnitrophica bacterium]|nr:hypothetical protein [Candidatus Omnitrophota bacterium]
MVSDIMQVTVGGTTRELNVQVNIMDNDVQLTWSEYAGADTYRVLWGNVPAVYPNSEDMMTTDYYISDLIMGSYNYIRVQALQDGQVIGESRELYVHVEEFVSSGGEIYFNPDPPMVGQYLMINMHFYEDLPFIPEVVVRMQSRDVSIMSTGQYRDYSTHLTGDAFDSPIIAVDVLDPNGGIIASRMPTGETYTEAMVPIDVIPDPPGIGVSLQVRMDFTEPPPFTPRLVVEFASGIRDYDFGQAPYMYTYDLYIPVSDMNSSILYMKAVNPNNGMMIGERAFSGGDSDGYDDVPFTVVPNPPIFGQSVNINLETDMAVSLAPKLRIYFDSGMQEVNMGGTLPGRYFTYDIGYLNSNISKIDIVDPVTLMVKHTWNPDVDVSPYVQAVNITPNSPGLGDAVNINLETGMSVSLAPKL